MNVKDTDFVKGLTRDDKGCRRISSRFTNRFVQKELSNKIIYPPLVNKLRERIRNTLSLQNEIYDEGHGVDGIVTSITFPGGDVYEHIDPRPKQPNTHVLRCNVVVCGEKHDILVGQKPYSVNSGDLMCYLVSKYIHSVPTIKFTRILMMFGFVVNDGQWETC